MLSASIRHAPQVTAFGNEAERIAKRVPPNLSVIFNDGSHVAEAIAEAVRRRRAGEQYLVSPMFEDALVILTRDASRSILSQITDADQRRQLFEALAFGVLHLNDGPITQQQIYSGEVLASMREFSQMGDGLFVRSTTERARVEAMVGRKRMYVAVAPIIDPTVPLLKPNRDARNVVVWAPNQSVDNLGMFVYALWHLRQPAIFVCQGTMPGSPHRFVHPDEAEQALLEAAVIVDTEPSDPGTALAFADRGYGVVTAMSTGAHEYLQAVATYYMHDFSSIHGAVTRARGDRRTFTLPLPKLDSVIRSTSAAAQPVIPDNPPLVSIVVVTHNRPRELRRNLEALALQTYPNVEVIVVNDCGEDVSAVVADFPFARYVCTPQNVGCCSAVNFGLRMARGEFATQVADDDRHYPTYITSLVAALNTSNLDVAHGNIVIRIDSVLEDKSLATYGHLLDHDADHDAFAAHWGQMLHTQGLLIRRESYEKVGFLSENVGCAADVDCYIKLSKEYDFAHVTNVIGEMSYRDDRSNMSSAVGDGLPLSIGNVLRSHAPPGSQLIAQRIEQTVQGAAAGAQRGVFFAPWVRLQAPIRVV